MKRISFILLGIIVLVLIAATILEKMYGTPFVTGMVYGSWWFIALWATLAITALCYMYQRKLFRRPATMLLHLSFVVILAGALVTHFCGIQGTIHLRKGEPANAFINRESQMVEMLPFALTLKEFRLHTYPGTQSAMDYESVVEVNNMNDIMIIPQTEDTASAAPAFTISIGNNTMHISMNKICTRRHYRFYQSGYDPDLGGTYLSVSYDPWGIGLTYTGYALLLLSMILLMVLPNEGFRRCIRQSRQKSAVGAALLFLSAMPMQGADAPKVLPPHVAAEFGQLYTYYNGRICPLQTVAIDFTTKLHGSATYKGYTAEQVFTGWMFFPTTWTDQPFIKIKSANVRQLLDIDGRYACYDDFFDHGSYRLDPLLADMHSGTDVADSRGVAEADEKMNILLMLFNAELLKIYPVDGDEGGKMEDGRGNTGALTWYSQGDNLPVDLPHDQWFFIKHSMDYIGELAAKGAYGELSETLGKIKKYQTKTAGASRLPSDTQFEAELLYNRINYTKPLAMMLLLAGIILFITGLVLTARGAVVPRWLDALLVAVTVLCLVYLVMFIVWRAIASGHFPLANGYETMVFMSALSLILTICLWRRHSLMPSFGFIMSGLTLLVAMMGQSNPQITPLMPVLASPLLSIHVCVIMMSYTLLAFTALTGIAVLARPSAQPADLTRLSQLMLYPALFLLTAGIFIGAVWANVSWGRYWGWDPKEVWALITMIVYALPLHRESIAWLRNPRHYHLYMLLAFLSVIITYFGVNFFLGGMHSYAAN